MDVNDLFQRLSFGEFNDHVIGMEGAGDIDPAHQDKVISHINVALTELYTKFIHKRDFVDIRMQEGVTRYELVSANAVTNDAGGFILDTPQQPFSGNLVKILGMRVQDDPDTQENEAQTLHLNKRYPNDEPRKVIALDYKTLYVPDPVPDQLIKVEFQAGHPRLETPPNRSQEIEIHPILESALEAHVAYQSFGSMNGEAHLAKSRILWGRYQQIIQRVEMDDFMQETETSGFDKLRAKGFV